MEIVQVATLGIIQGITEFLPVSSSGHLIIIPELFGWPDQGLSFDVVVHLGTLAALIVFFRDKILGIIKSFFTTNTEAVEKKRKLGIMMIVSIIPAGAVGFFFDKMIESYFRSSMVVAFNLIIWGVILGLSDRHNNHTDEENKNDLEKISWKQVIIISTAQAIALIPGTSRSGITMTAGLFSNLTKTAAAEFSFLMGIPIIALAGGLKFWEFFQSGLGNLSFITLLSGFFISAFSGFFAIWILMSIIKKWNYLPFVFYRILIGGAILFLII